MDAAKARLVFIVNSIQAMTAGKMDRIRENLMG
jgi:hypothetical protein